ncbi:MAG: hypothetical protein RMZ41_024790 [Nostoc sp. DedVER02]|uniref:hypothetical protein n=1 Tax=unclassified Nostoc TaxID=2593658 RepID=UPI002AD2FF4B|nr:MULTISPECIES: hypothetical protein [unclassified Nostoc]MDZ7986591.1 hypothetical protein [Nostoc sp. DedVER02]MDZ8113978.1 hypothetical protein [Nostoc sp. DedVER01b]
MMMIGETLGILPTGSLVGMVIGGMIELLSVVAPNREYDLVDNQLFMIFTEKALDIGNWEWGIGRGLFSLCPCLPYLPTVYRRDESRLYNAHRLVEMCID